MSDLEGLARKEISNFLQGLAAVGALRLRTEPACRRGVEVERQQQVATLEQRRRALRPLDEHPGVGIGEPVADAEILELVGAAEPIEIEVQDRTADLVLLEQRERRRRHP